MRAVESYFCFPISGMGRISTLTSLETHYPLINGCDTRVLCGVVLQQAATTLVSLDLVYFSFQRILTFVKDGENKFNEQRSTALILSKRVIKI